MMKLNSCELMCDDCVTADKNLDENDDGNHLNDPVAEITSQPDENCFRISDQGSMIMIILLLLLTRCNCQRWLLLGGYTGFEGESGAGATSQVIGVVI